MSFPEDFYDEDDEDDEEYWEIGEDWDEYEWEDD